VLVMDNLNTHALASLYATFPPAEARRLAERFEIHYTPKHGSWLNMAEMEIGVLSRQCLNRRIPALERMRAEARAWAAERNKRKAAVHWQFTTADARIKLRHLYPRI
jgi:predicted AAA+ superfamily ATPase